MQPFLSPIEGLMVGDPGSLLRSGRDDNIAECNIPARPPLTDHRSPTTGLSPQPSIQAAH